MITSFKLMLIKIFLISSNLKCKIFKGYRSVTLLKKCYHMRIWFWLLGKTINKLQKWQ